jgi:uncharacterized membrane protein YphA (DoxX/SURF4 family)
MDRQNPKNGKVAPAPAPAGTDFVGLAARVLIGLVFVVSGTMKASQPAEEFGLIISYYNLPMVTQDLANSIATFLPWLELLAGYALIFGYFTRQAALAAGAMLASFVLALTSVKLRDIRIPNCGCFGVKGFHPSPTVTLCMDLVLLAVAYAALTRGTTKPSLDNWADGSYT